MKLCYFLRNKLGLLAIPAAFLALASCSSYQYSGYEADGIYGESRPGIFEQENPQTTEVRPNNNSSYYKNLFGQQSQMVGEVLESEIFTDVESYTSNDGYENYSEVGGDVAYVGGNAPWGEDPDTYTINIINNGFGGFYSPWRFGYGYGYGWGFGNPYFGGWYDPFWDPFYPNWGPWGPWGNRWGRGWAYNGGFGYGFGWGWNNPYYGYWNNPYRPYANQRDVAYSRSARNSRSTYRNAESRRNSYSERIREIRSSRDSNYGTSRVRNSVSNSENPRVYTRTSRRSEPVRSYDSGSRSRSSSPVYQRRSSSNSSRSYESSPSRRSSPTRSTTTRSSSSSRSSGSSGTRSRSSGGRGGRGGGR